MKTLTAVALAAGGFLLYNAWEAANFANTVQVVFAGVDVQNLNSIVVKIVVQNITNASITVNSMSGNLLLNGDQLASISDFTQRTIAPNSQTEIDVTASPSWLDIFANVQQLLSTPGSQLNFTADGNINISNLPMLPFTLDKTISV